MTGAEFRRQVLDRWKLSDPELVLLDAAAGTLDLLAEIETSDLPLADRAREMRAQRLAFAKILNQLALPDAEGGRVASTTHRRARAAANIRWGNGG